MWGDKKTVEEGGVDELVKLYVRFHQEAEDNPELNDQARLEFHKLETGDKENTELWKWFVELTLAECNRSYSRLGIEFDSYAGESFYTDKMPAQVEKLKKSGLLKIDNGASIVDLSEYNMPPCLILKSDGSTLYPTRDIAAAVYRYNTYKFDKCIYVTSSQQKLHFQQLFKVIELMGYDFADKLVHVSYGTISVDGEKLSTRAGNAVLIRDLIDSAVTKVKEIMKEKSPDLENPDEVAEQIGVGAVVFYYLMNDRIKDTNFVMSEALSFDGNSGPYAQYTYARTCQLLNKAKVSATDKLVIKEKSERDLAKVLSKFSEAVLSAVKDYEPSDVTRYILDVCTAFNRFYHDCPILNAEDENVAATRVALTKATNTVLGNALPLICMKTPTKI
jgi:arginyl-tRNA synthetase